MRPILKADEVPGVDLEVLDATADVRVSTAGLRQTEGSEHPCDRGRRCDCLGEHLGCVLR